MILNEYEKLKEIDITSAMFKLKQATMKSNLTGGLAPLFAAYMLVKVKEHPEVTSSSYYEFQPFVPCSENNCIEFNIFAALAEENDFKDKAGILHVLKDQEVWEKVYALKDEFEIDTLKACVLFGDLPVNAERISDSVALLVNSLVKIENDACVSIYDSSAGQFSSMFNLLNPTVTTDIFGQYYYYADAAGHKKDLLGLYNEDDCFEPFGLPYNLDSTYDFSFAKFTDSIYKIGLTNDALPEKYAHMSHLWGTIASWFDTVKDDGKMAFIINRSHLLNKKELSDRQYFVKNGYLESVINLPLKLFDDAWTQTSLVILSHGNNKTSFVNAENICTEGRLKGARINYFSAEDVNKIVTLIGKTTDQSIVVSSDELDDNNFILDVNRYSSRPRFESEITLGDLAASIKRAASFSAREFDRMQSSAPTMYRCLMPGNIQNGIFFEEDLPYLMDVDEKLERFKLMKGDILLTKNGAPFKVAVCDTFSSIIANGNLYIIRVDQDIVDPYYLKAYLESDQGMNYINSHLSGDKIPMICIAELERMPVPLLDEDKRKEVALRSKEITEEVLHSSQVIRSNLAEVRGMFG